MADFTQHNRFISNPGSDTRDPKHCDRFELLLADAVDGNLAPAEQAEFAAHQATCERCAAMLTDVKRGAGLLGTLRLHPPAPSMDLVDRILAQTSHRVETQLTPASSAGAQFGDSQIPPAQVSATLAGGEASRPGISLPLGRILPFHRRFVERLQPLRQTLLQPRLAMTAAMAFFSVALTLNLTGVRVTELRRSDLRPSSLKRSFYEADAHVFRYYDNLRVVYELESRVRDLQRSAAVDSPEGPVTEPNPTPAPADSAAPNPLQPESPAPPKDAAPRARTRSRPGTSLREPLIPDRRLNAELRPFQKPPAAAVSVATFAHRLTQKRDLA